MHRQTWVAAVTCLLSAASMAHLQSLANAADWPQFRGPGGTGTSQATNLPATFNEKENLAWRVELPGRGTSCPIVWKDRIYLTCYTGYGSFNDDASDQSKLRRHLLCINRADGSKLWQTDIDSVLPEDPYDGFLADHGYASSTPVTDGERIFCFFGKTGVVAFDMEGKKLWQTSVGLGSGYNGWGSASSLTLVNDSLIVNASAESGALIALSKADGKEKWKTDLGEGREGSWSTPITMPRGDGSSAIDLIITVPGEVWAFNAETGKLRWFCEGVAGPPTNTSVVVHEGIVYAVGGGRGGSSGLAIRGGGKGDVAASHLAWKNEEVGSYVPSPVYWDGHLYFVNDRGQAVCLQASDGKVVYQERLPGNNQVYASLTAADGKLYAVSRFSGVTVLAAKPEFEVLAQNQFADDDSSFNASPAIVDDQILLRSDKFLYCIKQK